MKKLIAACLVLVLAMNYSVNKVFGSPPPPPSDTTNSVAASSSSSTAQK
jgi:hypothetical protein